MSDRLADEAALRRLAEDYGHLVDTRRWSEFSSIFTEDVVFDASDFGSTVRNGLAQLQQDFAALGDAHPICHHATNVVVDLDGDDTARIRSKGLCVTSEGHTFSCIYLDTAVRTDQGWRINERVALLRRPWAEAGEAQLAGRLR